MSERTRQHLQVRAARVLAATAWLLIMAASARAAPQYLLITTDLDAVPIKLASVDDHRLHYVQPEIEDRQSRLLTDCIAILKDSPVSAAPSAGGELGLLRLADGRRFPGSPATPPSPAGAPPSNARDLFAWHSNWLGRMEVRLDDIDWIIMSGDARLEGALPPAGRADTVLLTNGDVLEGLVLSIRDEIELEMQDGNRATTMRIPGDRIAAINMVAPPRDRAHAAGSVRRAWLADGTIMDVSAIEVDDGGIAKIVRPGGYPEARLDLRHVEAVLLSPGRMIPLAQIEPRKVTGPETRYEVPEPRVVDERALLGLSPIELRGPLRVEYALPAGAKRFAAEAFLPEGSRRWGDFDLIVRDGDAKGREVFRQRLNAARPRAAINVELTGEALTFEIVSGAHGPIQNHVVLHRAMLRVE